MFLLKIKPLNSRYRLRSNDGILSYPTFKTLTTLGDRAFVVSAPNLRNDLPLEIIMAKSVDTFKRHIFLERLFILSLDFFFFFFFLIFYTAHDVIRTHHLVIAFDEVERKVNFGIWLPCVGLYFGKTHIPVRTHKWPPRLIFAGACHGQFINW